jgi:hypothetical protein
LHILLMKGLGDKMSRHVKVWSPPVE